MNKIDKSEIPVLVLLLFQTLSLFTLSTVWGRIITLIILVVGLIIGFYSYRKKKISKERLTLLLIISAILFVSLIVQIVSGYYPDRDVRWITRTIRRLAIIGVGIYMYVKNN